MYPMSPWAHGSWGYHDATGSSRMEPMGSWVQHTGPSRCQEFKSHEANEVIGPRPLGPHDARSSSLMEPIGPGTLTMPGIQQSSSPWALRPSRWQEFKSHRAHEAMGSRALGPRYRFVLCLGRPLGRTIKNRTECCHFFILGRLVAISVLLHSASQIPSLTD